MKKILLCTILLCSFSAIADTYNVLISKEYNKFKEVSSIPAPSGPVCEINFIMNADSVNLNSLSNIELILNDDTSFDFGALTLTNRLTAEFDNATLFGYLTYTNGSYYYPSYAIKGYAVSTHTSYWLSSAVDASYRIVLNQATELKAIRYSDMGYSNRASEKYTVNFLDCDGGILQSTDIISAKSSVVHEQYTLELN